MGLMEDLALSEETVDLFRDNPAYRRFYTTETYDLNIFDDGMKQLTMDDFQGEKFILILGINNSGKSNTSEVLIEEFLTKGLIHNRPAYPIVILDVKGEYFTLRERYRIKVVGDSLPEPSQRCDEKLSQTDPKALAGRVVNGKESIVLSFFQIPKQKMFRFCIDFFTELYELEKIARYPMMIFIEEAQFFIPQKLPSSFKEESKQLKEITEEIAIRGRSLGMGACFISQRSQSVNKDIITQAQHMFLHQVVHPRDQDIYKELIPFDAREVVYVVPKLKHKCIYVHGGEAAIRQVRIKHSRDVASAPGFDKAIRYAETLREEDEYEETNGQGTLHEYSDEDR